MEKVSEADLIKRVKAFILNDNYAGALAVVKGVDASRIKNPPVLCLIGEVYMHEKQYEVAEEVFLRAYNRSPKNRKILDLITSLYIEMGEYAEAEYYYKEFISVASRDLHRYILRYRIDKGKGERLSVLIDTLERLKDYEYIEEWAYELATLYEAAGEEKKCIHECDEIVLWFGHGEYVDKAIALKCKLTGEPLPKMTTVEMELENERRSQEEARSGEAVREAAMARRARYDGRDPKPAVTEFSQADDVHVINPDNVLESAGVDTGIDTDMIRKAMETERPEVSGPMTNTGMLFDAMNSSLASGQERDAGVLQETDLEDEDTDEDEILEEEDPIDELEALLAGLPDENMTEEDLDDDDDLDDDEDLNDDEDLDDDDDSLEVEEALEGMTEDRDEVILEQAVFGGLPSGDMLEDDLDAEDEFMEDDLDAEDEFMDDDQVQVQISDEDEQFLAELFSGSGDGEENEDEVMTEDVAIPQTVKGIFATVPDVKNVHQQLAMTLSQFEAAGTNYDVLVPYDVNFVVLSNDKAMKSQIAIGIAKALNTYGICDKNKIVRAKASELNRQDFSVIFDKISGGCLIIEQADELSDASVAVIEKEVYKDNQDVAIVLESLQDKLKAFWKRHKELRGKFLNVINVSKYNEMELVTLAKGYIEKRGYELSPEAAIVLRDYFKKHNTDEGVISYEDVMTVVDDGIANLDKRNMKNLFMTVLDNKYEEADMLKLLPEDFKGVL